MENKKAEEFAKSILSNSKLDIENPDFNIIVMDKIRRKERKKILLRSLKNYSLTFVGIDLLIITLLRLFNISITDISSGISNLSFESMSGHFILVYIAFMITSILLIIRISGNGYLYSKNHEIAK